MNKLHKGGRPSAIAPNIVNIEIEKEATFEGLEEDLAQVLFDIWLESNKRSAL